MTAVMAEALRRIDAAVELRTHEKVAYNGRRIAPVDRPDVFWWRKSEGVLAEEAAGCEEADEVLRLEVREDHDPELRREVECCEHHCSSRRPSSIGVRCRPTRALTIIYACGCLSPILAPYVATWRLLPDAQDSAQLVVGSITHQT